MNLNSRMLRIALLCACVLATGCATTPLAGVVPGVTTVDELRRLAGEPRARIDHAGGGATLYYSHQPYGRQNYAVRITSGSIVGSVENLLTVNNFAKLRVNESTASEVRALLGPPNMTDRVERKGHVAWEYWAWLDSVPMRVWVSFSADDVVREVVRIDETPQLSTCPAPGC